MVAVGAVDLPEERQELLVAVPWLDCGGHLSGRDLQCGEQCGGAVAFVVVGSAFDLSWLHREHRRGAVEGLNLGLLVHAQYDRILRRCQIQADDIGDFGDQLRVGGELERPRTPRLYPILTPRAGDRGVADPEVTGQQA